MCGSLALDGHGPIYIKVLIANVTRDGCMYITLY